MPNTQEFFPDRPLSTAILFLVFNRIDTTKQVFEAIRLAKPPRLYIAADGARETREGEDTKVKAVRDYVTSNVDWACDVKTLFREENLGCKMAVSGAISWFFENEEMGIILEDDCQPSQSFFWYCEELLHRYRHDESIYIVSGDARGPEAIEMKEDYGFCKYPMIWGWASWARVWRKYDPQIQDWPKLRGSLPRDISSNKATGRFWATVFDKMYDDKIDTWDYQLCFVLLKNRGKCIVPRDNMIRNIGFGVDATHTTDPLSKDANRECRDIEWPLKHEASIESETLLNKYYDTHEFTKPSRVEKWTKKFSRIFLGRH